MSKFILAAIGVAAALGCSPTLSGESQKSTKLSKRQSDSVIAGSVLPGSGVVKKAMSIADAQNARAAMIDSMGQ